MKRRRTLIVSLLLVTALCMGIGYAAVSQDLYIKGSATAQAQAADIGFTAYAEGSHNTAYSSTITPSLSCTEGTSFDKKTTVNLTATGLTSEDDYVEGTFTVTNYNDCIMYLSTVTTLYGETSGNVNEASDDYFTVEVSYPEGTEVAATNGTATVKVRITLNQNITGDSVTRYFSIQLLASSTAPSP